VEKCHVTQIYACDRRGSCIGRGLLGTDVRLRVARRLARWMGLARRMGSRLASWLDTWMGMAARLGMGRTTFRRGTWILWPRMFRPTPCPWPVGASLDPC
jgi:hypothetical protein